MKAHPTRAVAAVLVLGMCIVLGGCSPGTQPGADTAPPTIMVSLPVERKVTNYADYTGRVAAIKTVDVRARVWGYLDKVNFKEGVMVKEGDVLYEIDPSTYEADFAAKEAQVKVSKATLELAQANNKRFKELFKSDPAAVSKLELDKYQAQEDQDLANVDLARANLQKSKLNLDWTKIKSAITGRIGRTIVNVGNIVQSVDQPTSTLLTTIVTVDPEWAYFDVDERTVQQVRKMIRDGMAKSARDVDWPVFIGLAAEEGFPHKGKIDFVDNAVKPTTGTLRLRGVFPNPLEVLSDGFFVRVRMPIGFPRDALLISDRAIDTDQGQKVVYVIGADKKVEMRNVRPGALHDGLRVIEEGLKAGEQVVVNGLQQIRPDMVVEPKLVDMPRSGVKGAKDEG